MKRSFTIVLIIALFLGIGVAVYAFMQPRTDAWVAAEELKNSKTFGFGGRGAGGRISKDEERFFRIFDSPKSHIVFRHLYDAGTPEAKAYAIVGLSQTALGQWDQRIEDFRNGDLRYESQSGCILSTDNEPKDLIVALESDVFESYLKFRP